MSPLWFGTTTTRPSFEKTTWEPRPGRSAQPSPRSRFITSRAVKYSASPLYLRTGPVPGNPLPANIEPNGTLPPLIPIAEAERGTGGQSTPLLAEKPTVSTEPLHRDHVATVELQESGWVRRVPRALRRKMKKIGAVGVQTVQSID